MDITLDITTISVLRLLPEGVFLLGFIAISLWQMTSEYGFIFLTFASIITILVGVNWVAYYPGVSIMMWAFGAFLLTLALLQVAQAGGPSRGISQFKSMYHRIRGR